MLLRIVVAELHGLHVRVDDRDLLAEAFGEQLANDLHIDFQQRGKQAQVHDVLHQDAVAHADEILIADFGQRGAEDRDVLAREQRRAWPRRVVDQEAARTHFAHVLRVGLGIHRDHEVDAAGARDVAFPGHADLVPGGQALDVRGKIVFPHDRDAHPEDGLHQHRVGTGRARAVHVGELDDEVVYAVLSRCGLGHWWSFACGRLIVDFCMSQAAVGQRSAQRPQ